MTDKKPDFDAVFNEYKEAADNAFKTLDAWKEARNTEARLNADHANARIRLDNAQKALAKYLQSVEETTRGNR